MFERYNDPARKVLVFAHDEARALQHGYVGTEHLLLGVLEQSRSVAAAVKELGVEFSDILRLVDEGVTADRRRAKGPRPYTPRAKRVLEQAVPIAAEHGHEDVGPEHILLSIVDSEDLAVTLLETLGAGRENLRTMALGLIRDRPAPATKTSGNGTATRAAGGGRLAGDDGEDDDELLDDAREGSARDELAGEQDDDEDEDEASVQPLCPGCDAQLGTAMRWKQFVVPGSRGENLLVTVVFCSQCGHTVRVES